LAALSGKLETGQSLPAVSSVLFAKYFFWSVLAFQTRPAIDGENCIPLAEFKFLL